MSKLGKEETRSNASALHKSILSLTQKIFPHFDVEQEYSIKVRNNFNRLTTLYLDIFIPKLKVAIECHGRQHFECIKHFGGKDSLKTQQMNDRLKAKWCEDNEVALVIVKYDDKITLKQLEKKIVKALKE
jgi:hypothetical protein